MKTLLFLLASFLFFQIDSSIVDNATTQIAETMGEIPIWHFILIAFAGSVIHIIGKFADEEKSGEFSVKEFFKGQLWGTIYGVIGSVAGVFMLPEGQLTYTTAFLLGYAGDSIMKKRVKLKKQNAEAEAGK